MEITLRDIRFLILFLLATAVIIGSACISGQPGVDSPKDIIHFPIGVAVHPGGRYAAVVNSDFSQAYKNGTVVIIDLATNKIVPEWTIPIGQFGGDVIFNHAGTRMYVAVRGVMIDVGGYDDEEGDVVIALDIDQVAANAEPADKPFFVEGSRRSYKVSPDPFGMAIDSTDHYLYVTHVSNGEVSIIENEPAIPVDKLVKEDIDNGALMYRCLPENLYCPSGSDEGALCASCNKDNDCAPIQFDLAGDDGSILRTTEDSSCLSDPRRSGEAFCAAWCEVSVTQTNEYGDITRMGCPEGYRCMQIISEARVSDERKMARGSNQAAISPLTGTVYVTHRDANSVGVIRPYFTEGIGYQARVEEVAISSGFDLRGIAFNATGDKLYAAVRNTYTDSADIPGIAVIDTSVKYENCDQSQYILETTSCEKNQLLDFIEVGLEPANIAMYKEFLYVPLFASDELYVIDTRTRQVVAVIDLAPEAFIAEPGIYIEDASPYDISIYTSETGVWALVTNFGAHEIAVLHLFDENGSPINKVERKIENRAKLYEKEGF